MESGHTDILFLNRSFWPDIEATGQFLTELCEALAAKYRVTVIAGYSYYVKNRDSGGCGFSSREEFKGIDILRVWHTRFWKGNLLCRIINWLTYCLLSFFTALKVKPKIIIACTDPPFLGIIAMALSKIKSMPYIYNCRDLYPDVAYGLGKLKQGNLAARLFEYLNRLSLRLADVVVCLGESMKTRIVAKRVAEERVKVISDWVDVVKIKPVAKNENPLRAKYGLQDKFVIMHSGNLGLSQEFDSILQAVAALESYSLSLVFVGDGAAKESLKDKVNTLGLKNTFFLPYFSGVELSLSLGLADLQLVLLKEGMAGAIVPSKVYAIMAAARPYLAITDKASEPAIIAERFACGLWVKPGDVTGAVERIRWSINHPDELQEMGKRARAAAQAVFNKEILVKEWFRLLETRL